MTIFKCLFFLLIYLSYLMLLKEDELKRVWGWNLGTASATLGQLSLTHDGSAYVQDDDPSAGIENILINANNCQTSVPERLTYINRNTVVM